MLRSKCFGNMLLKVYLGYYVIGMHAFEKEGRSGEREGKEREGEVKFTAKNRCTFPKFPYLIKILSHT